MIKKIIMTVAGLLVGICVISFAPVKAFAALPCSYDIINDANAQIANATANYNMAVLNHQATIYNYNLLVSQGASALDIQKAADAITNAANIEHWWLDQLNNAKAYLANINDRAAFEDKFADNRTKINNLTKVRADKDAVTGAFNVANALAVRIKDIENAIAGYQQQLAVCPSLQAQIDALNVQLVALKAEYEAKLAIANQLNAQLIADQTSLAADYDPYFEDYQRLREEHRGDSDWEWLENLNRVYGR